MEEGKKAFNEEQKLPRRDFLKKASFATAGGLALPFTSIQTGHAEEADKEVKIDPNMEKIIEKEGFEQARLGGILAPKILGKIGYVSSLTFGAHLITEMEVLEASIAMGMNMVDTAPRYYGGNSEELIGRYLEIYPQNREKLILSTKLPFEAEDPAYDGSEDKMLDAIEKSLKRLNTYYIDIVYVHGVGGIHRVANPQLFSAFEKAKERGWVRHLGITSFNGDLSKVAHKAIETEMYDVIMLYYNFVREHDELESKFFNYKSIFKKAKEKNIGIIASEPFAGGFDITEPSFRKKDVRGASIRWLLSQRNIDSVRVPIRNYSELEKYVAAVKSGGGTTEVFSGAKTTGNDGKTPQGTDKHTELRLKHRDLGYESDIASSQSDESILKQYRKTLTNKWNHNYCRACDVCLPVCIFNVAIPDILRYKTQFENFGMEKKAILSYKILLEEKNQAVYCETCSEPCKKVCPFGVDIKPNLLYAHQLLSI